MVERTDLSPPRALIDLARMATTGDVSPRRHHASRALLLERSLKPRGTVRMWASAFAAVVVGSGAIVATVSEVRDHHGPHANRESPMPPPVDRMEAQPTLTIQVTPESAKIYWDDELLDGNPATLTRRPDGKAHRVKAVATGFTSKTETVSFDGPNISVSLNLDRVPAEIGRIASSVPIPGLQSTIDSESEAFRDCFDEGLEESPSMKGRVTVVLKVAEDGHVTAADLTENHGLSIKVTSCLLHVATGVHFQGAGKPAVVGIPISFSDP
jgi:hypothetical protein